MCLRCIFFELIQKFYLNSKKYQANHNSSEKLETRPPFHAGILVCVLFKENQLKERKEAVIKEV